MKKVLIIRFSSIGDIILTTPIIRCIKKQLHCEVHFLTKSNFREVLKGNPYISKTLVFDNNTRYVIETIKAEKYDLVLDLQKNLKSRIISLGSGSSSLSYNKLNIKKWLWTTFKINLLPKRHLVDRYFDSLKKIGVFNDGLGCDFTLEDGLDINRTENLPTEYIVLVLGATYYTKRIPDQKSIEIINLSKIPVVLIGGKDVSLLGTKLASQFDRDKCINLCGKLSLQQSAAVMKTSKRVITADTGMMHIAAALRCNIDVIWGNTTPDFGMYPYLPKEMSDHYHNHEVLGLSCRPCSKLGTHYCPKRHFQCMNNQKISALFEEKLLGN